MVSLVTGAGGAIGAAIAQALAGRGDQVVLVGRSLPRLEAVAAGITEAGGSAVPLAADVGASEQVEAAFAEVARRFGTLDVLVNAAGVGMVAGSVDLAAAEWDRCLRVNLS